MPINVRINKKSVTLFEDFATSPLTRCDRSELWYEMNTSVDVCDRYDARNSLTRSHEAADFEHSMVRISRRRKPSEPLYIGEMFGGLDCGREHHWNSILRDREYYTNLTHTVAC